MNLLVCIAAFLFFDIGFNAETNIPKSDREEIMHSIVEEAVGANCFCRLGDEVGPRVSEYPNSYYDFGSLKYWKRFGGTNRRSNECQQLCEKKVVEWLRDKSNDELCAIAKKCSSFHLVAYSKVGGRKWRRTYTKRDIPCTSESIEVGSFCDNSGVEKYTDFNLQIMRNGGKTFRAHATPRCKVPVGWGYHWRVCEFNTANNECIPNTELSMPEHWWTFNHSCSFNGYTGSDSSGNVQEAGVFDRKKTYRIIFGIYGPNQEWIERKKYFNQYSLMNNY